METYLTAWKQASFGEYEGLKSIIDSKGGGKFDEQEKRERVMKPLTMESAEEYLMNFYFKTKK